MKRNKKFPIGIINCMRSIRLRVNMLEFMLMLFAGVIAGRASIYIDLHRNWETLFSVAAAYGFMLLARRAYHAPPKERREAKKLKEAAI